MEDTTKKTEMFGRECLAIALVDFVLRHQLASNHIVLTMFDTSVGNEREKVVNRRIVQFRVIKVDGYFVDMTNYEPSPQVVSSAVTLDKNLSGCWEPFEIAVVVDNKATPLIELSDHSKQFNREILQFASLLNKAAYSPEVQGPETYSVTRAKSGR